jgi:hypothetical protein
MWQLIFYLKTFQPVDVVDTVFKVAVIGSRQWAKQAL